MKEYAIRVYEDYSIDKEKYTLYALSLRDVKQMINNALRSNHSLQVIVFNLEDE